MEPRYNMFDRSRFEDFVCSRIGGGGHNANARGGRHTTHAREGGHNANAGGGGDNEHDDNM